MSSFTFNRIKFSLTAIIIIRPQFYDISINWLPLSIKQLISIRFDNWMSINKCFFSRVFFGLLELLNSILLLFFAAFTTLIGLCHKDINYVVHMTIEDNLIKKAIFALSFIGIGLENSIFVYIGQLHCTLVIKQRNTKHEKWSWISIEKSHMFDWYQEHQILKVQNM